MSGRNEELLSAYIDGELSGDERASVEQWLADDVAARELLDEMAETSGWVRSLPRAAAPAGMRGDVLTRLRVTRTATPRPAPAARPGWRRGATWMATSAAGLLVAVVVYRIWPAPDDLRLADAELSSAEQATAADFGDDRGAPLAIAEAAPEDAAMSASTSRYFAAEPPDPTQLAMSNAGLLQDELAQALGRGDVPVPGETLEQLGQVGDQVVVFQYRVVDTQDILGEVQVLLNQNGIYVIDEESSDRGLREDSEVNGRLQAIYLDAPQTNFTAAVNEITNLDGVTSVMTNTVAFVEEAETLNSGLENRFGVGRESESATPLSRRSALAESVDESGTKDVKSNDRLGAPASEPVPAVARESQPASQQSGSRSLDLSFDSSEAVPAQDDGFEPVLGGEARNDYAYQVLVPARIELLQELESRQDVLPEELKFDDLQADALSAAKPEKLVRRQSWNFSKRSVPEPRAGDRVRAVILLVPQKSE